MTDLLRHLLQRAAEQRQGRDKVGVTVALHDLAGDWGNAKAQCFTDELFDLRWNRGMSANRAGYFTHGDLFKGGREPLLTPAQFIYPEGQLQAEGRWFCVDAMRPAYHEGVFILYRCPRNFLDKRGQGRAEQYARLFQLGCQCCVENV